MLTATLLDGKSVSESLLDTVRDTIRTHDLSPSLHVLFVGEDEASESYVRHKKERAREVGIDARVHRFDAGVDFDAVRTKIEALNDDPAVDGMIVQLPLPGDLNETRALEAVSPRKDVDGLHPLNFGKLMGQGEPLFYPPTPRGILHLLDHYEVDLRGQTAVMVGMGRLVGRPLSQMLVNRDATVVCLNEDTPDLTPYTSRADVLVAGAGVPRLIGPDHVADGVVVVDAGIHRIDGELVGDVDFEAVAEKARLITPVPGGVGPLTVAGLLANTCESARRRQNLR